MINLYNSYQCCFCGKTIVSDVTELVATSNWEKNGEEQIEQQMFCHMDCLKEAVSDKFPLYIADLN